MSQLLDDKCPSTCLVDCSWFACWRSFYAWSTQLFCSNRAASSSSLLVCYLQLKNVGELRLSLRSGHRFALILVSTVSQKRGRDEIVISLLGRLFRRCNRAGRQWPFSFERYFISVGTFRKWCILKVCLLWKGRTCILSEWSIGWLWKGLQRIGGTVETKVILLCRKCDCINRHK